MTDHFLCRALAMDRARRSLQDRYDLDAAVAAERAAAKEEEKRLERIKELENLQQGKGYRNKVKVERKEFSDGVARSEDSSSRLGGSGRRSFRPGTLTKPIVMDPSLSRSRGILKPVVAVFRQSQGYAD